MRFLKECSTKNAKMEIQNNFYVFTLLRHKKVDWNFTIEIINIEKSSWITVIYSWIILKHIVCVKYIYFSMPELTYLIISIARCLFSFNHSCFNSIFPVVLKSITRIKWIHQYLYYQLDGFLGFSKFEVFLLFDVIMKCALNIDFERC